MVYDNAKIGHLAAGHFLQRGFKRIAYFNIGNYWHETERIPVCRARVEEAGAQFHEIEYFRHFAPGSKSPLDELSEYLTCVGNVIWCVGKAKCGSIGVRKSEPGHEKFDTLSHRIKAQMDQQGGWPGNTDHYELTPE